MSLDLRVQDENINLFTDLQNTYLQEDIVHSEDDSIDVEPKTFSSIANADDLLQMYLKDIGKIRLLSFKEEKNLGRIIKEGKATQADIAKRKLSWEWQHLRLDF